MNEDRIEGAATTLGGRVETNLGELTGDRKLQSDGLVDQARGSAQNMFGGAQDALRSALDQAPPEVRDGAERAIAAARKNPLLATLAVGAVGLILARIFGRTARPGRKS
ncbi:MAG: CsbD family protein [Sphingomicrobium sp.]